MIQSSRVPIEKIEIYDRIGRMVFVQDEINQRSFTLNRGSIPDGMYLINTITSQGIYTKKIIFQ
jgi:hypothetical protein